MSLIFLMNLLCFRTVVRVNKCKTIMLCCPMNKILYVVMKFIRKLQPFLFAGNQLIHTLPIGTLYNLFVAIHATWFNIKIYFHTHTHTHTQCMYVFYVVLRRNRDISLYSLNSLASVTEGDCVYFAVRTDYILTQVDFRLTNVVLTKKTSGRRLWSLHKRILRRR
jgi:hypothetical protein